MRLVAATLLLLVSLAPLPATPASALYTITAAGGGAAQVAGNLTPPDPPLITGSGVQGSFCNANVSWAAPPAGATYRVRRTIGATTTTVAGPVTSAGILSDSVPVASLDGPLSYALFLEWTASPNWFATSAEAPVTNC